MKHFITLILVILSCLFATAQTRHVKIVAVNDMHANLKSMPRLAAFIDSLRTVDPHLILLSAGDNRTGNPYNDKHEHTGYPMTALMNKIGFNATAIGNHEFDGRHDGLRYIINNSRFKHLCANISVDDTCRLHIFPYTFLDVEGVKIGIIGSIQINTNHIPDSHPDNLHGMTFHPIDSILPSYRWMRDQCDVLVLLSHDGYETNLDTADKYPWIDVILGGHSHTLMQDNFFRNGVLITQAKSKLSHAAIVDIDVDKERSSTVQPHNRKSQIFPLSTFSKENEDIRQMVADYYDNPEMKQTLTTVASPFQTQEELANMEMDALAAMTGADIAIQNGGGVRYATFPVGNFTKGDLLELDPFGNNAVVYDLSGKEVADFIMNCYDIDEKQPVFVSGITYEMDIHKGAKKEDTHPVSITIKDRKGEPLSYDRIYKVVTNSYVSSIINTVDKSRGNDLNISCSDLTEQWLRKQPSLNYTGTTRARLHFK